MFSSKQCNMSVTTNRASMLLNKVSVSAKWRLTLAKKDIRFHQTEPLFEPNKAFVYVWNHFLYSLCGVISTLGHHKATFRDQLLLIESHIHRTQRASTSISIPRQIQCTRLTLAYSRYPEWGLACHDMGSVLYTSRGIDMCKRIIPYRKNIYDAIPDQT